MASGVSVSAPAPSSKTDTTPPVIVPVVKGTLGANGWYTSNVALSWTVTDAESKVTAKTGCTAVTLSTNTSGTTYTCSATSKGGTSSKSVVLKRDATLPSATVSSPTSGAIYTAGQAVAASYSCADAVSGIASCAGPVANGANIDTATAGSKSFAVKAVDNAGNTVTTTVTYSVVQPPDTTPPVITPNLTGTLGNNGWYIGNVTLAWTVSDAQSAISASSGCTSVTLATDTAGTSYTCSSTSQGGTSSNTVTLKRDASLPTVTLSEPANGASYAVGQAVTARYSCDDALSGVASCAGTVADGSAIDTASAGSRVFTVKATDAAGNTRTVSVTYTVAVPTTNAAGTQLLAWNDLGMHCMDSDYSVFTLLPPFNTLNAQLVVGGKLVTSGVTLSYEAMEDPSTSVNSFSRGKTNFWDYDLPLFGANLTPDVGLTGNPTASYSPAPMVWSPEFNWFEATGIPITPIDDGYRPNPYPMVKVTARNSAGVVVATSNTVLPVSSEINCNTCHASNTGSLLAKPKGGWVNNASSVEKDWRMNVLRLHDEKNAANPAYQALLASKGLDSATVKGLEASALGGKPVLCDTCHNSNALAVWGIVGEASVSSMTSAMHNRHAKVSTPGSTQTLDSIGTRDACYNCHPGKDTQCLRGAMGNPVDTAGKHTMECQSCHGSMLAVGNPARVGWQDMPTCQSCHQNGSRSTVAGSEDPLTHKWTFKNWTDQRFASNPDNPATGVTLFRYSAGHGGLQCEACHNSTHAEFTDKPSASGVNDNLRAISVQGYAAALRECTACHTTMPSTNTGGPHGMHDVSASWVTRHHDSVNSTTRGDCLYCHGSTSAGSPLAVVKVAKTFNIGDGRSKSFAVNERVTCWSCHNGPGTN